MIELDAIVAAIIRIEEDPDNFLVRLRVDRKFDEVAFAESVSLVRSYHTLNKSSQRIDKPIVQFLYDAVSVLEGDAAALRLHQHPLATRVSNAHALYLSLLDELLSIEPRQPGEDDTEEQLILF